MSNIIAVVTLRYNVLFGRYLGNRFSATVRCRKLIVGKDIDGGCRCAISWCDLDLTFDLVIVTMSFKISGLFLGFCKV